MYLPDMVVHHSVEADRLGRPDAALPRTARHFCAGVIRERLRDRTTLPSPHAIPHS